jgi:outer membrane protein assembly factor BamB
LVTAPTGGAPQLRYDAANSGYVPDGSVPTESVTDRWTFDTGGSLSVQPIVVDGTVFVGNTNGQLYAINAQNGTERWSRSHDAALNAGVVVAGGIVYVPAGNRLLAYSAATGDGQFARDFNRQIGTPTLADGVLYIRSRGRIYALDATSGDLYWKTDRLFYGRDTEARANELTVTVVDGNVYVLYPRDGYDATVDLYSFPAGESAGGSPSWTTEVGFADDTTMYDTTVTAAGGTLYVGLWDGGGDFSRAGLLAVDPSDGSEIWRYTDIGAVQTYPVATDDTVYAAATDELAAVDPALGTAKWTTPLSGAPTSPVLVGEIVVVPDR